MAFILLKYCCTVSHSHNCVVYSASQRGACDPKPHKLLQSGENITQPNLDFKISINIDKKWVNCGHWQKCIIIF